MEGVWREQEMLGFIVGLLKGMEEEIEPKSGAEEEVEGGNLGLRQLPVAAATAADADADEAMGAQFWLKHYSCLYK